MLLQIALLACNRNSSITILIRAWLKKSVLNKASVTFGEGNNGFEVPGKVSFPNFSFTFLTVPKSMVIYIYMIYTSHIYI